MQGDRSRRWGLTDEERERIAAAAARPFGATDLGRALARHPRLAAATFRSALRGAVGGLREDADLIWFLRRERTRRVVPDAATGAAWFGVEPFLEVLRPHVRPETVALELGAGAGRVSRHVAPLARELVCTDVSATLLDEARENLATHGNVRYVRTHGFRLPQFGDDAFDLVFSHDVFEFFDGNPALALLEEVARVLRPGGVAVVSFYTFENPFWAHEQLDIARRAAEHRSSAEIRPYTTGQMEALFRLGGLRVTERHLGGEIRNGGPSREEALAAEAPDQESLNEQGRCIFVAVAAAE